MYSLDTKKNRNRTATHPAKRTSPIILAAVRDRYEVTSETATRITAPEATTLKVRLRRRRSSAHSCEYSPSMGVILIRQAAGMCGLAKSGGLTVGAAKRVWSEMG